MGLIQSHTDAPAGIYRYDVGFLFTDDKWTAESQLGGSSDYAEVGWPHVDFNRLHDFSHFFH